MEQIEVEMRDYKGESYKEQWDIDTVLHAYPMHKEYKVMRKGDAKTGWISEGTFIYILKHRPEVIWEKYRKELELKLNFLRFCRGE